MEKKDCILGPRGWTRFVSRMMMSEVSESVLVSFLSLPPHCHDTLDVHM